MLTRRKTVKGCVGEIGKCADSIVKEDRMGLFDKHSHVKKNGWELYKKEYFIIDRRVYENIRDNLDGYMSGSGLTVGLFNATNSSITYIDRCLEPIKVSTVSTLVEKNFLENFKR